MTKIKYYGLESHFNENVTFYKDVNIQGNLNYDSLTVRNLTVSEQSILGTVKVSSGIVTATSGITTYYGDAANMTVNGLTLASAITGIGAIVPSGVIVMWSGTITNIPTGWALCNGSNGTPDLRSKFIVGATSDASTGVTFNADTGAVKDTRKFMTMLEDYWLPRREGGRGTEITTLPGGENLGQMEDVDYFRKKLYKSLSVPVSRLESDGQFSLGRGSEISRDEVKFAKFVERLRDRFTHLFDNILEIQLLLTGVMTREEWKDMKNDIKYDFQRDNYYAEIKEQDMMNNRLAVLGIVDAYVGKYYSVEWIRRHVLRQTDEEIQEIDAQMSVEVNAQAQAETEFNDQQAQQQQMQQANDQKNADIQAKNAQKEKSAPQKLEIKVKHEVPGSKKIKEEFNPKPLTEEDKRLIESMTRAIEKVSKEDLTDEMEEIKDDL
jgi:23S rRNA maturation mini-RNase III